MHRLNIILITAVILFSSNMLSAGRKQDDLSPSKMKKVTSEILDIFVSGKTEQLTKYISREWLDEKNTNVNKYKINNYDPDRYYIAFAVSNVCAALIYGQSWTHLLVFKFTDEYGTYRLIPRGISEVDSEYIDPWWAVETYVCEHKGK